jgi:cyclic pyranopterin phosphate synthase
MPSTSEPTGTDSPRTPEGPRAGAPGERARGHVTASGEARMIDVGAKPQTEREALARARVAFPPGVLPALLAGEGPKGAAIEVARVAAIQAAKRTSEWIPLCHPLSLDGVEVAVERPAPDELEVRCRVRCTGRTGVEMEALVGASAGALALYDMAKGLDHGIRIGPVELLMKRGGASGAWTRPEG